jgi:hypothetical protein
MPDTTGGRITPDQMLFLLELCCVDPQREPWTPDLTAQPFAHEDFWPTPATEWAT